jgi:thioredoxin
MTVKNQFYNLQDLIASSTTPVLLVFYANWCGASQRLLPILSQVKTQIGDQIQVVEINSDNYPQLAAEHQVQALPTSILFQNGFPVLRIKGVLQADQLIQKLQKYL